MSREFNLFERDDNSFKTKLIRLMDLLISNKSSSRMESYILISVSYIQLISGFYSDDVGLFSLADGSPNSYLTELKNVIRVKDLFKDNFLTFQLLMYFILIFYFLFTFAFIYTALNTTKNSFYALKEMMINLILKLFIYMLLNPILDLCLSILCVGTINPNYNDQSCSLSANPLLSVICFVVFIYSISIAFLLCFFYNNSVLLSNCFYARISCNYEILHTINIMIFSILLAIHQYLSTFIFILYNILQSFIFLKMYFEKNPFYDSSTNFLIGFFHIIYAWTSIFAIIFSIIQVNSQSIIYLFGIILLYFIFSNIKNLFMEKIVLETPFYKINNNNHLLFYMKYLIDKINTLDNVVEDKSEFIGIIQMHMDECPMGDCMVKNKKADLYLPLTDEWSVNSKPKTSDRVYMYNFVTFVLSFFIAQNSLSPEAYMNISLYYLSILGNYCQSMIYIKRVSEFKLSLQEEFAFIRAKLLISKALVEKLRPSNENCFDLEEINSTMYFKYEDLSQKFYEEITNDVNLNLEFWKIFKSYKEDSMVLDFSKVFSLTDRIRISKEKIANLWDDLFETYNGYNEIFELYENYVMSVNDEETTLRELEGLKNKIIINNDNLGVKSNFYKILFSKDTGIIIVNGEKGKEGNIEKINENIRNFFNFSEEELKNLTINYLMPKMFAKNHKIYMERYLAIGEKRILDKSLKTYAKDKQNNIIVVQIIVKLFPILGDYTCFAGLLTKEPLDDVVLLDNKFNVQGMSQKLMTIFKLNENVFQENEIPLYLICPQFINHYKLFMHKEHQHDESKLEKEEVTRDREAYFYYNINRDAKVSDGRAEEYEINENAELEFEIQIPQFLKNYVGKSEKGDASYEETPNSFNSRKPNENGGTICSNKDNDKNDEEESLMNTSNYSHESASKKVSTKDVTKDVDNKEFQNKINYYRSFFDKKQFEILEKEIEKVNLETKDSDSHKFIFTFNKHTYGDNQQAFIVRCIDNREDADVSLNSENNIENNINLDENLNVFTRSNNVLQLNNKSNICQQEIDAMEGKEKDYYKLSRENKDYSEKLNFQREEIINSSRIFGVKKTEGLDDDALSQASQGSSGDDVAKKARIEEIKFGMMKNVSKFYTLNFIKLTFFLVILSTLIFSVLYLYLFDNIFVDSLGINQLSTNMYINTFTISNYVSNLISMRSLFNIIYLNQNVNFSTFNFNGNDAYEQYFNYQRDLSLLFSSDIQIQNSYIEFNLTKFLQQNSFSIFWDKVPNGFTLNTPGKNQSLVGYPHAIEVNLILGESMLYSDFFTISNAKNTTSLLTNQQNRLSSNDILNRYKFYSNSAIEYAYNVLIGHQTTLLTQMNGYFTQYNKDNVSVGITVIMIYSILIAILAFVYIVMLYLTNISMEQSLYKVSKISKENINDTIGKIETFNDKFLIRLMMRDKANLEQTIAKQATKNTKEELLKQAKEEEDKKSKKNKEYNFEEVKQVKKLTILNLSYFQVVFLLAAACAILIPVYSQTYSMIVNANSFLVMKDFIFKDLISASLSIVSIKCAISRCDVNSTLSYNTAISSLDKQNIIDQIKFYPELDDFYNNKYLLSICDTLYNVNSSKIYNNTNFLICQQDNFIKSANHTQNLLKTINDNIFALDKLIEIQKNSGLVKNNNESYYKPFESQYFSDMEYGFYNFILNIPIVIDSVLTLSLTNYMLQVRSITLILIIIYAVLLVLFSFYIIFIFTGTLIHLLSISRCIIKIIPTGVITNTPELEIWMESNY